MVLLDKELMSRKAEREFETEWFRGCITALLMACLTTYLAINKLLQFSELWLTSQLTRKLQALQCPFKNQWLRRVFANSHTKSKKGYGTGNSQAVTHPSTNPACSCLTSESERDRVYSTEYGRIRHEWDLFHDILSFTSLELAQVWFRIFQKF